MSIATSLFQKDLYQLSLPDLEEFFSVEQSETSLLEFKSGDVELEKIHREVCAFLNTEGGLLIIGAPKEQRPDVGKCIGALTPSIRYKSVDSIIQSIATGISPSPIGIKGHQINTANGLVHVIEVKQSVTPPHQVNGEGKYYIRLEKEAKAAPHGIVEALFHRRQKPSLHLKILLGIHPTDDRLSVVDFVLSNPTDFTAEQASYVIRVKGNLLVRRVENATVLTEENGILIKSPEVHMPIVKGVTLRFELDVEIISRCIFIDAISWCKDAKLHSTSLIYDKVDNKIIMSNDSNSSTNEWSTEEVQNRYYSTIKEDFIDGSSSLF